MDYIEISVFTTTESSEAVSYILEDEGAAGVAIEDPNDFISLNHNKTDWDYVEPELIQAMGTDVKVKGYFPETIYSAALLETIQSRVDSLSDFGLDKGKGELATRIVKEEDWSTAWKQYFKPFKAGERVVVKPTWESYDGQDDDIVVEIDPGMAFGTGNHETTLMCIKLLERYIKKGYEVYDVGCGSGILGITAAKLGAHSVLCVDLDGVACKVAAENVSVNKEDDKIKVKNCNLLDAASAKADLIVANIIADIIMDFTPQALLFLKPGRVFISSGIILDRQDEVIKELKKYGFDILEIEQMGEWCAIAAKRD
ncbi:50S ribosomal protein L11 methyltransferase [Lutispora saccharofermentans]|uniref:Ribosomal protein L11 methyltransferase n=1 Tax=Lutispora saccharofermentans TaxID=3024236 RepID=A0ABT1NL74_9FIRM|nr:50S ribosomal protein L11 methyltransferase [Lutispora saccharofermentans]MCQ1530868.1 50S ribosomal protein L11 methyltransferase [Lutispora saccharofermentans]